MMMKETLTVDQAIEFVGEFVQDWNADEDHEDELEFGEEQKSKINQELVDEINTNIKASQESNVAEEMIEVFLDEEVLPGLVGIEEAFYDWFEKKFT